ncbi:transglycosylase domain-containing protein [bacterium]|nr:transglycosylase domain-containing protein [bacterium]
MRPVWRKRLLWFSVGALALLTVLGGILLAYVGVITHRIDTRIAQLRSSQASSFYGFYPSLVPGATYSANEVQSLLQGQGWISRQSVESVIPGEYHTKLSANGLEVVAFRTEFRGPGHPLPQLKALIIFEGPPEHLVLKSIQRLDTGETVSEFAFAPKKVASYFAGRLRTQNAVSLSEMPVSMRTAAIAIEDVRFLEHHGVSLRSTLRALMQDLMARRFVQGGSTITQQLMKNLFFSNEKAISRKIKELLFALITEARHSKEDILEAYLNEVYMGQWGPHEIHGVSEGAQYYFNRPVSRLSLAQSATLAAIIQAPNAHDPRRHPEKSLNRRNLVLKKMLDAEFILDDEYNDALQEPLGVPKLGTLADVDYAIDLVLNKLPSDVRARLDTDILSLYLPLNPFLQGAAADVLTQNIDRLKTLSPEIAEKEKRGVHLQGALISVDVKNCTLLALQGGTSYRITQFNRVTQGKRQPGSLFKPFVFLAGFSKPLDPPLTAITELDDSPFEWSYDRQTWSPKNYDDDFRGPVTARDTLEKSINVPTARLAEKIGLDKIREVITKAGVTSPVPLVPSLSLGGIDVTPIELAEAFTTLANLGQRCELRPLLQVFDSSGNLLLETQKQQQPVLDPIPAFQTVHLMRGVIQHGSGRGALAAGLGERDFAGKTGTTNEGRDTWFVGFSPTVLTLIWMGYDEHEKLGLTGASAAVPMWASFMKAARPFIQDEKFAVPEGLREVKIERTKGGGCADPQVEYFLPGTAPSHTCD